MNVPAAPLNGFTGTALQVPGVPGTPGGGLDAPPLGEGLGLAEGLDVGDGALGLGDAVRDGVATAPLHTTPLRLKLAGAGFDEPFHDALNPKLVVPPVASAPFQVAFVAVTALPLCVADALHACVTACPAVNDQVNAQPLTGSPKLVMLTLAVKPVVH
jgi:hypothetical protein